jgi:two-component system, chemotaxis family, CheB/CheR fusion protein
MAFVLIQHLDPKQKSLLREILSRATTMPVLEVQDGMAVEPNCVYVIPPNTKMAIAQGQLHLTPRDKARGMVRPVDTFFLSLADDLGSKAIAIVLSGGDGDGSRGLEAVKGAGGITFAQREDSAQFSSMPNTAVATGHVDFILSPQAIAEELANISRHPYVAHPTPDLEADGYPSPGLEGETTLQTIFTLLRTATNIDFTLYKHTTLKRRILRRMVLYRLQNLEDYVTYLREHPAEVQALYDDVLINVTSFFRDPLAFETLTSTVFPTLVDRASDVPIRIWVAGCSTGEEAYSICICLLEFLDRQPIRLPIQVYATDISDWAIEKARSGFYQQSMAADVSPERLQRFFVPVEGGYQISKSVRELCVFAKQNLCSDPPFSKLDLISCRNVLIYLGAALQRKVLPTFHYGLKPTGFLMLGTSETIGEASDLFALVDKKHKIYARKLAPARLTLDLIASTYPSEITDPRSRVNDAAWNELDLQKEADRVVLDRYSPVGVVIDQALEILHFRGQTSPYLEPASGRASFNLLKMAKEGLKLELRTAIHQAKQQDAAVRKEGLQIREREQVRQVSLEVIPLQARGLEERYLLVLFEEAFPVVQAASVNQTRPQISDGNLLTLLWVLLKGSWGKLVRSKSKTLEPLPDRREVAQLQQELATTKEYLRSIIEEQEATNQDLRAANEEILSSNEELQSSNEELETAKEEIQATNEELNVINDELQRRNFELTEISSDLQNLISTTNIPILMLSSDLRIRRCTPLAQSILHLIPTDVGRPFRDINPTLNLPDLGSHILEVINTLTPTEQEVQDYEGHWYDLRIRPYRTIDNRIDGAMVMLVDIDALKRSMAQLQSARNYAQAIVETVREPLVVLDDHLRVLTANQSFYQIFQVTAAETEQRLLFELGDGQWNILGLRERLERILPNETQLQDFEVEHDFEQIGRKIMLLNACTMTQSENGKSILLAIDDITDRKQAEVALQVQAGELSQLNMQLIQTTALVNQRNEELNQFAHIVSHDLKAPLRAISNLSTWIEEDLADQVPPETRQNLDLMRSRVSRMERLIDGLLAYASIGYQANQDEPFALNELLLEIVDSLDIPPQFAVQIPPHLPTVTTNRLLLSQVFTNLISNAVKHHDRLDGQIQITAQVQAQGYEFTVSDDGPGIAAKNHSKVFDIFQTLTSSDNKESAGIGLTIVNKIIERIGGQIDLESELGQGATFTFTWPVSDNWLRVFPSG